MNARRVRRIVRPRPIDGARASAWSEQNRRYEHVDLVHQAVGEKAVDKSKDIGGKVVDTSKDVAGKTAEGARPVGEKSVDVTKKAADKTKKAVKKVIP